MSHWQFHPIREAPAPVIPIHRDCAECGQPMIAGTLKLEQTFLDFVLTGWAQMTLFFHTSGRKRVPIARARVAAECFRCDTCGAILILGKTGSDTPCLSCSTILPAGASTCPNCGWSYGKDVKTES